MKVMKPAHKKPLNIDFLASELLSVFAGYTIIMVIIGNTIKHERASYNKNHRLVLPPTGDYLSILYLLGTCSTRPLAPKAASAIASPKVRWGWIVLAKGFSLVKSILYFFVTWCILLGLLLQNFSLITYYAFLLNTCELKYLLAYCPDQLQSHFQVRGVVFLNSKVPRPVPAVKAEILSSNSISYTYLIYNNLPRHGYLHFLCQ
ncbi:MAG: hypothetical protein ACOX3A_00695 [bacterium]|jgi:hypothetical protein